MRPIIKAGLHPRNRFSAGYDFTALTRISPALAPFVRTNVHGDESIDYADAQAVKALNQALLKQAYDLQHWDIPPGYLCPPIPGRSDYLHYLADLISLRHGSAVRVLDVGSGANAIYPLIGASEYGWRFVAAEVDPVAYAWGRQMVAAHVTVASLIEYRQQSSPLECFKDILRQGESFDLTMCNPPFHASAEAAAAGSARKSRNLGRPRAGLNFGGRAGELWCAGGELAFIQRMISQSVAHARQVGWFTTLVSKSEHLQPLQKALRKLHPTELKIIPMAQGQKKSRILAWTFQPLPVLR
jgi:23S rRNA (adenine1618-N6)-methyltransferase